MNHQFVVMWDCHGLEYVGDITADEQRVVWETLQGKHSPRRALANPYHLRLRAQYNPQRHYEIYIVEATDGITADDIRDMFEASPQTAADTIRRLGTVFHSDRAQENRVVIR
jgi:hypothetical protein